jgi:hypothetical protein
MLDQPRRHIRTILKSRTPVSESCPSRSADRRAITLAALRMAQSRPRPDPQLYWTQP